MRAIEMLFIYVILMRRENINVGLNVNFVWYRHTNRISVFFCRTKNAVREYVTTIGTSSRTYTCNFF